MRDPLPVLPLRRPPDTTVVVPGSKSITNRALVIAALARGTSTLVGVLIADDTEAMVSALRSLGIGVAVDTAAGEMVVDGCGGELPATATHVDARQSGTTGRFLTPVAALGSAPVLIDGHPQLRSRPMGDLVDALVSLGVAVESTAESGHLPLRVTGPLTGGSVSLPGDISSQFVSGLMLAGAIEGLRIELSTEPVSLPYIDMTEAVMESFGATVDQIDVRTRQVGGGYRSLDRYLVEPDASAASYFLAAAAMTKGRVRIDGLGVSSLQGDLGFVEVLQRMGAEVTVGADYTEVVGVELRGIEIDMRHISDTAPTLAVVAAFADGPTTVTGIGFVRGKESDRIAGPVEQLRRCGVDAEVRDDGFVVRPTGLPHGATIDTYEDHRMAMSFALIGLMVPGIEIRDPGCVDKTFRGYFDALDQLR